LMTFVVISRSAAVVGAMFRVVWANSQNASTPRMMPKRGACRRPDRALARESSSPIC
jgi:hypothetical protein